MTAGPSGGRRLTVLFAPDSFKGSLTAVEVARALAAGWRQGRPDDELVLAPLADGGEGTLEAIDAAGGWTWRETEVADPLGRPVRARWLLSDDRARAIVEMAEASGLLRLAAHEREPIRASSDGTGQLVGAAIDAGAGEVTMAIGGSAFTDGGAGFLRGLGGRVDRDEAMADLAGLDRRLAGLDMRVGCDVTNPLLGPTGSAATYGPQKGATPDQVADLDRRLAAFAGALETASGRTERETPGAGASGGLGFALLCIQDRFRSFGLRPGVDLVMEATGFDEKLARADVVITGEGRIDAQTAFGKTALGVGRRAADAGKRCIAVGGGVTPEGSAALAAVGVVAVPAVEQPMTIEAAMATAGDALVRCGERIARLVGVGASLGAAG